MAKRAEREAYIIPEEIWKQIKPLLPPRIPNLDGDESQMDKRQAMEAILSRLRNGCDWESLPDTVCSRFREWRDAGVFQRMWKAGFLEYEELRTLFWHGRCHMKRR